jgi:hypothetical protein
MVWMKSGEIHQFFNPHIVHFSRKIRRLQNKGDDFKIRESNCEKAKIGGIVSVP